MLNLDNIKSSYSKNQLHRELYSYVMGRNPKVVIEFGCLEGYSTVTIAKALKDLDNGGKLIAFDLWEKYKYKAGNRELVEKNLSRSNLRSIVELGSMDFFSFLENPIDFDLLHLDISNDGEIIEKTIESLKNHLERGSNIIFEGGSKERDNEEWMIKYNKKPINSIKYDYKVLTNKWPSMSLI